MSSKDTAQPHHHKPKLTNAERHKRFVETAKKVEAAESFDEFHTAFDKLNIKTSSRNDHDSQNRKPEQKEIEN